MAIYGEPAGAIMQVPGIKEGKSTILALKEIQRQTLALWIPVVLDCVFMPPPLTPRPAPTRNSDVETIIPSVMVSGGGAVGRWLGHRVEPSRWVEGSYKKRHGAGNVSLCSPPRELEGSPPQTRDGIGCILILDFEPPEL